MPIDEHPTVYSTDPDFQLCPRCKRSPCRCPKPVSLPPGGQTAAIQRETKGRGGKTVTVIRNLQLNSDDLKALATQLKQACGTGGTVKDGTIEIQGDHREKIASKLRALGYKTKFTGG
ncbi:MAG: stress response translation initiation inhibitor YciH [Chloroflexi bacterium]|jgi:translation initiation factor 1|nr:stress response translation initiation inhibitor YciH [Chloroflexota bacterium]